MTRPVWFFSFHFGSITFCRSSISNTVQNPNTYGIIKSSIYRKKSLRIFFKLCPQQCCILQATTNRLRPVPTRNSNGNTLSEAFFDFRPHGTIHGLWTKIEKRFEKRVPVRFSGRSLALSICDGLGNATLLGA